MVYCERVKGDQGNFGLMYDSSSRICEGGIMVLKELM